MKKNNRLEKRRQKISKDIELFVKQSFDIVDRIHEILLSRGMEQKDLAKALGKTESEISKWMTGTHNFTIKTITKIESILGESIIETSKGKRCRQTKRINISEMYYDFKKSNKDSVIPLFMKKRNIYPMAKSSNFIH